MNKQRGFAIPYAQIAIALAFAALIGAVALYRSWYETEKANVVVEKQIHKNFVQQVQHMTAEWEQDHAALVIEAHASNITWEAKHNEQVANNALLWANNDRLRDRQKYRSEGGVPKPPANVALVDCGNSEAGFSAAFNEYRKRYFSAANEFGKEVLQIYFDSGTRVRQEVGRTRDRCINRTVAIKGWAEDHPAFDHIDPDPPPD